MNDKYVGLGIAGLLAAFGGSIHYLYLMSRDSGMVFSIVRLLINSALAFFVGFVMGDFLPVDVFGRNGLIALSGFLAFPILLLFEEHGMQLFRKIIKGVSGDK